jgi:hydroxymethylpyrimidine/phosphomethylpyrimidine kinase
MAVVTALTAQNTRGVSGVEAVSPGFVEDQIEAIFEDIRVDAVKIGMIANAGIARAVAGLLSARQGVPIVLDPVMVAKGGSALLAPDAVEALTTRLLPLAAVLTPNLPEAAALLGEPVATDRAGMAAQATRLRALGPQAVLVKGGHLEGEGSPDVLATADGTEWFEAERIATANTHGTGCTLSSAIAAELAKGANASEAVRAAKTYLAGAIAAAERLSVGSGHGPVHHFHALWREDR